MKRAIQHLIVLAIILVGATRIHAASMSDAEADILAGQYAKALAKVSPAARAGDPHAQYLLASLYLNGNGVPKDVNEGVKWLEKAAERGYVPAQADVGASYLMGLYHPRDTKRGAELLLKAASRQEPGAMYNLGVMYRDGLGVQPDRGRAESYFRDAAERGHSLAQYGLARLAYQQRDYRTAAKWYEKAGEQGDMDALYNLGHMYHEGQGVDRDYKKANALFLKSAELARYDKERRGYRAFDMLGQSYQYAKGVPKDLVEAYKWYFLAAMLGHPTASAHAQAIQPLLTQEQIAEAKQRAGQFAKGP